MERLMPVIKEAVVSGLIAQATRRDRRLDLAGIELVALSGFVLMLATVFASLAGYHWLTQYYSPPAAYIMISGVLLLSSAIFFLIGLRAMNRGERKSVKQSREEISKLVDVITDDLAEDIAEPVRENPKTALAAAALAGFLAGDRIH